MSVAPLVGWLILGCPVPPLAPLLVPPLVELSSTCLGVSERRLAGHTAAGISEGERKRGRETAVSF